MGSDVLDLIIHRLPGESTNGKPDEVRVMTVRMPATLHEALKDEARVRKTSANKLAVAKLAIRGNILDMVADQAVRNAQAKAQAQAQALATP